MNNTKTWLDILLELVKSKTVWAFIISMINLAVYLKTGYYAGTVGLEDPAVIDAINSFSGMLSFVAGLAVPFFRYNNKDKKELEKLIEETKKNVGED